MLGGAGTGPAGTMTAGTGLIGGTLGVRNYTPFVGAPLSRVDAIKFDLFPQSDQDDGFSEVTIVVRFESGEREVVRVGGSFVGRYAIGSSRILGGIGYSYAIRRHGGWPHGILTVEVSLEDPSGNILVN